MNSVSSVFCVMFIGRNVNIMLSLGFCLCVHYFSGVLCVSAVNKKLYLTLSTYLYNSHIRVVALDTSTKKTISSY